MPVAAAKPRGRFGPAVPTHPIAVTPRRTSKTAPVYEAYREHFPVGVWWSGAQIDLPRPDGSTVFISPDDATGTNELLHNRQYGYHARHMQYAFWLFSVPAVMEDTQHVSDLLEDNAPGGPIFHVVGPTGRTGAVGTGIAAEFLDPGMSNPSLYTRANADAVCVPVVQNYQDHPGLLAYCLRDDVVGTDPDAAGVVLAAQSMQDADPYGRPAVFVHIFPNTHNLWADFACKVALTYVYPVGRYANGTDTAEGDFMSFRVSDAPNVTGLPVPDWVDKLRWWFGYVPAGVPVWLALQTHRTSDTSNGGLRTPTDRELRKQFWVAVGEGVKGIFWFPGDNSTDITTKGVFDTTRQSSLAVIAELADRLTPEARAALLKCDRVADKFTTSGGGTTGLPNNYPSAYVSTLRHANGEYYCVVCNHSTSSANVTISSSTLSGWLVSIETGARYKLGRDAVALNPLDGTIFRLDEMVGVRLYSIDFADDVEAWWSKHALNPTSPNYIPVGSIKTWPNVVTVNVGDSLQAAINNAPDYTTFVLASGYVSTEIVEMTRRSHLHFVSANPANKAKVRSIYIWGTTKSHQYFGTTGSPDYGLPEYLNNQRPDDVIYQFYEGVSEDFFFKDLIFDGGGAITWFRYYFIDGVWHTDHYAEKISLWMRSVKNVLIEGCTVQNYVHGEEVAQPPPEVAPVGSGLPFGWYTPAFSGNSGIMGVGIRNSTIAAPADSRGWQWGTFFDGARDLVLYNNAYSGKLSNGWALFLTNDDYTYDNDRRDGRIDVRTEERDARYVAVVNNTGPQTSDALMAIDGRDWLLKGNAMTLTTASTIPVIVRQTVKCSRAYTFAHRYEHKGGVADGNTLVGGHVSGAFLEHNGDQRSNCTGTSSDTQEWRSKFGGATIKNNVGFAPTAGWTRAEPGTTLTQDFPDTVVPGNT